VPETEDDKAGPIKHSLGLGLKAGAPFVPFDLKRKERVCDAWSAAR